MKPIDSRAILPFLKQLQRKHQIQSYVALIGGIVLALIGPLVFMLFYLLFSTTLISSYGFFGAYWRTAAILLPIFFVIAYRLRGSVLEHTVPDGDTLSGRWMNRTIAPLLIVAEIANSGPRLTLWAIGRIRGHHRVRGVGLGRISQAIAELSSAHEGVSPAKLLFPDEPPRQLELILAFLLYHEIIDLSKRGDRVWLTSEFQRRFQASRGASAPKAGSSG